MSKIKRAIPNDDYTLLVELDNNHKVIIDLKPRLEAIRFNALRNRDKFKQISVENGNTIVWDKLCQMTIDEIISSLYR